jgi:hypothetical protein
MGDVPHARELQVAVRSRIPNKSLRPDAGKGEHGSGTNPGVAKVGGAVPLEEEVKGKGAHCEVAVTRDDDCSRAID